MNRDKFDRLPTDVDLAYLRDQEQIKDMLDQQAEKNYFYYQNDQIGILTYLNKYLRKMIKNSAVYNLLPRVYTNEVPRLIRRLSMAYNEQPQRDYNKEPNEQQEYILQKAKKYYKDFHRQAKLQNTILVRPVWREYKGCFEFMILDRHLATVIEHQLDYNRMEELQYWRRVILDGKDEYIKIIWTAEDYYAQDAEGNNIKPSRLPDMLTEDGANPYGRIPFVKLKLEDSNDFWGDGLSDLVNLNEHNNAKLCDTYFKQWMSFGYPVGTNLGVTAEEFPVSPYEPMMINNAREGMIAPSLQFTTPDHQVIQDQDLMDWSRKVSANTKGMSGSSMSESPTEMSGYRKMLDEQELIESNQEDQEALRDFESELFDLMVEESELYGSVKFTNMELTDVQFRPYESIKTVEETWTDREYKKKYKQENEIDWLMQDYGYTRKEAESRVKELSEENTRLGLGDKKKLGLNQLINEQE